MSDRLRSGISVVREWSYKVGVEDLGPLVLKGRVDRATRLLSGSVLGYEETLVRLRDEELSLARFGDGEFVLATRQNRGIGFQSASSELGAQLRSVLNSEQDGLMVCLPPMLESWRGFWVRNWPAVSRIVPRGRMFGNSMVTRPEVFRELGLRGVGLWRDILVGKEIVIVTGLGSRFELDRALFGEAPRVRFVYTSRTDAFFDIPRLLGELKTMQFDLAAVAAGPSGTILAAELAAIGRRCIDLGHLTNSYRTVFVDGTAPERQ